MIIGLIFDFYCILKRKFSFSVYLVNCFDLLFFIVFAVVVFGRLLQINSGQVRWYIFAGVLLGSIIYYLMLSELISKKIINLIELSKKIYSKLSQIASNIIQKIKAIVVKIKQLLKKLFPT